MAGVTLATRELKNKATGLDLSVPNYEDIPGAFGGTIGGSVLYHIIVVTRLFYFKTPGKHKESDVVQFMVPQKYHVFEELYQKLSVKFPSVTFPPLPKRVLLANESVFHERRRFMETVLQQIARTPKLACSSLLLEFLGAKRGAGDENKFGDAKISEERVDAKEEAEEFDLFATADLKGDHAGEDQADDRENDGLFTVTTGMSSAAKPVASHKRSVFGLDDDDNKIDDLFIPTGALPTDPDRKLLAGEDNSELLRVDDNLDELFRKPKTPPKPNKLQQTVKLTAAKPVVKPRPKPDLKPKPAPEMTFQESQGGEDELLRVSEGETPAIVLNVPDNKKAKPVTDEDLFTTARKKSGSLRKASHEEDTLDDIFKVPAKPPFNVTEDEDDLFKSVDPSHVSDMNVDDISQYIQQNLAENTKEKLSLF